MRKYLAAAATAMAAGLGAAHVAQAAQPVTQYHVHFSDTFTAAQGNAICGGFPIDEVFTVTDEFLLYANGSSRETTSSRSIATNPATGKSIVLFSAGQTSNVAPIIDTNAGTITLVGTFTGIPESIQTLDGRFLLRDVGLVSAADTFDLSTGAFLGEQVNAESGPHPIFDAGFGSDVDCQVALAALT